MWTSTQSPERAYSWNAATESLAYSRWGCRTPSGTWQISPATKATVPSRRRSGFSGWSGSVGRVTGSVLVITMCPSVIASGAQAA